MHMLLFTARRAASAFDARRLRLLSSSRHSHAQYHKRATHSCTRAALEIVAHEHCAHVCYCGRCESASASASASASGSLTRVVRRVDRRTRDVTQLLTRFTCHFARWRSARGSAGVESCSRRRSALLSSASGRRVPLGSIAGARGVNYLQQNECSTVSSRTSTYWLCLVPE